jgi:hypothetical protein
MVRRLGRQDQRIQTHLITSSHLFTRASGVWIACDSCSPERVVCGLPVIHVHQSECVWIACDSCSPERVVCGLPVIHAPKGIIQK